MGSPFPGMDPYLEKHWRDVHARLIVYASDQMRGRLPRDLKARIEERVFLESADGEGWSLYPDIRVIEQRNPAPPRAKSDGGVAVADPLILRLTAEPMSEGYIQIVDAGSGNRVVTVIEVISLSNKVVGDGQDLYLKKQRECRDAGVSLVEIDLVRAGKRVLAVPETYVPKSHRTVYRVCVRRGWNPWAMELYRVPLQERLPAIQIPLRESDVDIPLDLQPLIDLCYENGDYDNMDYAHDPIPPLEAEDAAWALVEPVDW